jgi:hypothetical protein
VVSEPYDVDEDCGYCTDCSARGVGVRFQNSEEDEDESESESDFRAEEEEEEEEECVEGWEKDHPWR